MKTKSFKKLLESQMSKEEIAEITRQAELEIQTLRFFQNAISVAINEYMEEEEIGFNELVRRLNSTATQVAKIRSGEANLTLSSLAHVCALLGKGPQVLFQKNKK